MSRHTLFSVRLASFLGGAAGWTLLGAFVAAVALAGSWLVTEYRLREGENALSELLDGRHFRFLSAAAVADAAPRWAKENGLATRPAWVRVRISENGGGRSGPAEAATEAEAALRDAGLTLGRRAAEARLQLAARLVVEARCFPFVRRRLIEAEFGTEREGEYRLSRPGDPWDDLPDPEALDEDGEDPTLGHVLPPLPSPTAPTLAALDAWRAAEQALARGLGHKSLAAAVTAGDGVLPPGGDSRLGEAAEAFTRARAPLRGYLAGPGRAAMVAWLGVEGTEEVEAAAAAMAHLDVVLRAGAADRAATLPLLAPYLSRAERARTSLGAVLSGVGVLIP